MYPKYVSDDFRIGFAKGVKKGRKIERYLCVALMIIYVVLFAIGWKIAVYFVGC
jgi:hypothetical protein